MKVENTGAVNLFYGQQTVRPARSIVILYSDLLHSVTQRNSLQSSLEPPQLAVAVAERVDCSGKQTEDSEFKIFKPQLQ